MLNIEVDKDTGCFNIGTTKNGEVGFEIDYEIIDSVFDLYIYYRQNKGKVNHGEGEPVIFVEGFDTETDESSDMHISFIDNKARVIFINREITIDYCDIDWLVGELSKILIDAPERLEDEEDIDEISIMFAQDFLVEHSKEFNLTVKDDCNFKCPNGPSTKCTRCRYFQAILKKIYDAQEEF